MNEKLWKVNFSILYEDGRKDEDPEENFSARTIDGALRLANQRVRELYKQPGVKRVVVWNIGIMEWDVF